MQVYIELFMMLENLTGRLDFSRLVSLNSQRDMDVANKSPKEIEDIANRKCLLLSYMTDFLLSLE